MEALLEPPTGCSAFAPNSNELSAKLSVRKLTSRQAHSVVQQH